MHLPHELERRERESGGESKNISSNKKHTKHFEIVHSLSLKHFLLWLPERIGIPNGGSPLLCLIPGHV